MLDVSSSRWAELDHAYGAADELPRQLYALFDSEDFNTDPYDVLFGRLCHQGTIYSATYAAVPHCVAAIDTQSIEGKISLLVFLGQVAISTDAAPIPPDLETPYRQAMLDARDIVVALAKQTGIPPADYWHLLSAVPAIHGYREVYRIVDWMLTADEVQGICRHCNEEFTVASDKVPFTGQHIFQHPALAPERSAALVSAVGIQGKPGGAVFAVTPSLPPDLRWDGWIRADNAMHWLLEIARTAEHPIVADKVLALFGTLNCPICGQSLALWDAAIAQSVELFNPGAFE